MFHLFKSGIKSQNEVGNEAGIKLKDISAVEEALDELVRSLCYCFMYYVYIIT